MLTEKTKGEKVIQVNRSIIPLQGLPVLAPEPFKGALKPVRIYCDEVSCSIVSGSKDTVMLHLQQCWKDAVNTSKQPKSQKIFLFYS